MKVICKQKLIHWCYLWRTVAVGSYDRILCPDEDILKPLKVNFINHDITCEHSPHSNNFHSPSTLPRHSSSSILYIKLLWKSSGPDQIEVDSKHIHTMWPLSIPKLLLSTNVNRKNLLVMVMTGESPFGWAKIKWFLWCPISNLFCRHAFV